MASELAPVCADVQDGRYAMTLNFLVERLHGMGSGPRNDVETKLANSLSKRPSHLRSCHALPQTSALITVAAICMSARSYRSRIARQHLVRFHLLNGSTLSSEADRWIVIYYRTVFAYRRRFYEMLAQRIKARGYRLAVITADEKGHSSPIPGVRLLELGAHIRLSAKAPDISGEKTALPKGLLAALKDLDPVAIVTEDLIGLPANLLVVYHKFRTGTPYLLWSLGPHILGKRRSRLRFLVEPFLRVLRGNAAGFILYSQWGQDAIDPRFRRSSTIAPNSTVTRDQVADHPRTFPDAFTEDTPMRLLSVGRLEPHKRIDRLLAAIADAAVPWHLDIIGGGPALDNLQAHAAKLGIDDRVTFHGPVYDDSAKRGIMADAHLGVMPGLGGLFIQETLARGIPVLCGPADGTEQDLVRKTAPLLYMEDHAQHKVTERLEYLARHPEILASAADAGIRTVRETYNVDVMA
ncbi:MAG: glycosyltransferase, partial [Pseudomonadota bacterium]